MWVRQGVPPRSRNLLRGAAVLRWTPMDESGHSLEQRPCQHRQRRVTRGSPQPSHLLCLQPLTDLFLSQPASIAAILPSRFRWVPHPINPCSFGSPPPDPWKDYRPNVSKIVAVGRETSTRRNGEVASDRPDIEPPTFGRMRASPGTQMIRRTSVTAVPDYARDQWRQ
jgi:hypothetical protein